MVKEDIEIGLEKKMLIYYGIIILAVVFLGVYLIFMIFMNGDKEDSKSSEDKINNITQNNAIVDENNNFTCESEYQYDNIVKACTKVWDLDMTKRNVAKTAVEYIGEKKGLTVKSIKSFRCDGCYLVNISDKENVSEIIITDWKVHDVNKLLTLNGCSLLSGRPVIINIEGSCKENEMNLGPVTGFTSETICCVNIETKKISQDIIPHGKGDVCNLIEIICDEGYQVYHKNDSCGCEKINQ